MTEIPLFNPDMLNHIYKNFLFFFKAHDVYKYFLMVMAFLLVNWLLVKHYFVVKYSPFEPVATEEKNNGKDDAFIFLLFSFMLYVLRFSSEEQTVLNNFDSMSFGFISSIIHGITPIMMNWRFTPLSHIDGMLIYGITNNFFVIGLYCVLKQILVLYLMYKCLHFVPQTKRFYLLALINFIPAVFSVNNIVFPEQNVIIFVLLSWIGIDKFQRIGAYRYLLLFLFAMNCAIYTKETVMLFYAGCGLYLLYDGMRSGRISRSLIKKPWLQLKKMPIEWLMFVSMLVWLVLYYAVTPDISNNRYLRTHATPMADVLRIYAVELIITLAALILLLMKIRKKQFDDMCLFMEGSVIGSLIVTIYITVVLRIAPSQDCAESYYLYLPAVFCTVYVFENIKQKSDKLQLALLIAVFSAYQNWNFYANMEGNIRYELMEFFETKAPKKQDTTEPPMTVYFYSANMLIDTVYWKSTGWSASFWWMLRDRKIRVKMDKFYKQFLTGPFESLGISYEPLASGDYVVINRKKDPDLQGTKNLIYKNKVYDVYLVN